jgi:hypothetical protein
MSGMRDMGLQLRSLIKSSGELEISLVDAPTPEPGADEVVVRIEQATILRKIGARHVIDSTSATGGARRR